jgi:hypothetical protein
MIRTTVLRALVLTAALAAARHDERGHRVVERP